MKRWNRFSHNTRQPARPAPAQGMFLERLETRALPSFISASAYPVGAAPRGVTAGDFNNDGVWDLATANQNAGTVSVRLGDGTGGFGPAHDFPTGAGPVAVAAD